MTALARNAPVAAALILSFLISSPALAGTPLFRSDTDPVVGTNIEKERADRRAKGRSQVRQGPSGERAPAAQALERLMGNFEETRTKIRLVTDNVDGWTARWDLLERATKTIDVTYFVFKDDIFGKSFLGMLHKKATNGVKIRLMVDAFGARPIVTKGRHYLKALMALPNVEVRVFNPKIIWPRRLIPSIRRAVSANHDKILLVDGYRAITGGRNIGWHYMASPEDKDHTFEDTDVVLEGGNFAVAMRNAFDEEFQRRQAMPVRVKDSWDPAGTVRELRLCYLAMKRFLSGGDMEMPATFTYTNLLAQIQAEILEFPSMKGRLSDIGPRLWKGERAYPTRILDKHGLFGEKDEIKTGLIKLMDKAEKSIYLQNAYVILRKDIHSALARAAQRGVEIKLLTNGPASTNHLITQAYFLRDWKNMMIDIPTLRIFAGKPGITIHSKCFVIDDAVASVGSYNLDPLSTDLNSEIVAVVDSPAFAMRLRKHIDTDIAKATEYLIERQEDGSYKTLIGPADEITGKTRFLLDIARRIPFLRGLL